MTQLITYLIDDKFDILNDDSIVEKAFIDAKEPLIKSIHYPRLGHGVFASLDTFEHIDEAAIKMYYSDPEENQIARINRSISDSGCNNEEAKLIANEISKVRIEISEFTDSFKIKEDKDIEVYKATFGMQLIVPKGKIEKLRFKISLKNNDSSVNNRKKKSKEIYAYDGFPKSNSISKNIFSGKITLRLSKALKIIPVYGEIISDLIDIEIKPWEINLGKIYQARTVYSGNLTSQPEWYFEGEGIENEFEVSIILKKTKISTGYEAYIQAFWEYNPGFFRKMKMGTDKHKITMHNSRS